MSVHDDEAAVDVDVARRLLRAQRPELGDQPIETLGSGTDNTMYRVGADLLMRLPRTPGTEESLRKELTWLPVLRQSLTTTVPEPVFAGAPADDYSLSWALYRWLDGDPAGPTTVTDWATYGADLAGFVRELRGLDLGGATRSGDLAGYRGGPLGIHDEQVAECLAELEDLPVDLDLDALARTWSTGLSVPPPPVDQVWLHSDLKPSNVLVTSGRISAVIDFGGLCVGHPDAEHAPIWDVPRAARSAYRDALALDDATWIRARAWAVLVGLSGITYYWQTWPAFAEECRARLQQLADDED